MTEDEERREKDAKEAARQVEESRVREEALKREAEAARARQSAEDMAKSAFLGLAAQPQKVEPTTFEPVSMEEHQRLERERFDRRREQIRQSYEEQRKERIDLTMGGSTDPEMAQVFAKAIAEINSEIAQKQADRLAKIDEEERQRLERIRRSYERD
jgi:hypothetical protein